MRRAVVRALGYLCALTVLAIGALAVYVARTWDRSYDLPLPEVRISTDPAVLARGEYLVYGPAHCVECHSGSYEALTQLAEGKKVPLSGGLRFNAGPLGYLFSKNLTPDPDTGIGRYSDGQIARMMRYSVKPDGRASIEPMMPFGNMSDDDLAAVISFLRAQPPVRNAVPEPQWTLFGKVLKSVTPVFKPRLAISPPAAAPAQAPTRERGEYLARYVSNCVGCHTPRNQTSFAATGPDFSGGFEMEPILLPGADPNTWFKTPNITPSKGSALLKFPDRDTFVARFRKGGRHYSGSVMPWEAFAQMTADDLAALYEYLRTLAPIDGFNGDPQVKKGD